MKDNLKKLCLCQKKLAKNHKFSKYHHKYNLGELELLYKEFFACDNHSKLELDIAQKFNYCDRESLNIIEKFIGD